MTGTFWRLLTIDLNWKLSKFSIESDIRENNYVKKDKIQQCFNHQIRLVSRYNVCQHFHFFSLKFNVFKKLSFILLTRVIFFICKFRAIFPWLLTTSCFLVWHTQGYLDRQSLKSICCHIFFTKLWYNKRRTFIVFGYTIWKPRQIYKNKRVQLHTQWIGYVWLRRKAKKCSNPIWTTTCV